jgi:hypothetical protein
MAFISLLDERARPKGSRDPLGFELVWVHYGRKVVGNLTTVTSSWQNFGVALLGFHWSNELCKNCAPADKQEKLQEHFIRYEQLAGYLRCSAKDEDIMGITRVKRKLSDAPNNRLSIGVEQYNLILSDQISYGLWGLYSSALRESGLINGDGRELTSKGLKTVSLIESKLKSDWYWKVMSGRKGNISVSDVQNEGKIFLKALRNKYLKELLISELLNGPGKHPCQSALYKCSAKLEAKNLESGVPLFIREIKKKTKSDVLTKSLHNIEKIERVLVISNIIFNYCRLKDGELIENVAKVISEKYDFNYLAKSNGLSGYPYEKDLEKVRLHLIAGNVSEAIEALLSLNKKIMDGRDGAAWVSREGKGKLRVRVASETAWLPEQKKIETKWDYNYFLRSYMQIASKERA